MDISEMAPLVLQSLHPWAEQAILVKQKKDKMCQAELTAWERQPGWRQVAGPMQATLGRGGMVAATVKTEGDGFTPAGTYALGLVFGSEPTVLTTMPYRQTTVSDVWVDDPTALNYNQWVSGQHHAGSVEQMLRTDGLYRYGIVIEYNTQPVIPGKGSAIFVHCWQAPGVATAGCVALAAEDLLRLIAWLAPAKQPVIILEAAD